MSSKVQFLYLTQDQVIQAGGLDMTQCLITMEETLKLISENDYVMGGPNHNSHGLKLTFPKITTGSMPSDGPDRRFMALIAYLGGQYQVCGCKWYGSNVDNKLIQLPRSIHTITLNDVSTGAPFCIMAGNKISSMRTGAMTGVGSKYLSNPASTVLAIIGIGEIGQSSCEAILNACPHITELRIFNRTKQKSEYWANHYKNKFNINTVVCDNLEEAVQNVDIISFATSGQITPLLKKEWIKPGALVIISAECDFDDDLWNCATIAVDNWKMYEAYQDDRNVHERLGKPLKPNCIGKMLIRVQEGKLVKENFIPLADVVNQKHPGRQNENDIILLYLDGMCVEDVAWATTIYRNAVKNKLGTILDLF